MPAKEPLRSGLLGLRRTPGLHLFAQLLNLRYSFRALLRSQVGPVLRKRGVHLGLTLRADLLIPLHAAASRLLR